MLDFSAPMQLMDHLVHELAAGVGQPDHPFWLCAFASVGLEGLPQCRTVVNRGFGHDTRTLLIYADTRSPKIAELRHHPHATLLFYAHGQRLQLRLQTSVIIHVQDAITAAAWEKLPLGSQQMYQAATGPSATVTPTVQTPLSLSEAARHLAVLECQIESIDVLQLHREANQRLLFKWQTDTWHWLEIAP